MNENIEHISIRNVAELVGVNVWTIRFWVSRIGILKPHRDNNGNLFFTPEDVEKIKTICTLSKERGMKIKEVKRHLEKSCS